MCFVLLSSEPYLLTLAKTDYPSILATEIWKSGIDPFNKERKYDSGEILDKLKARDFNATSLSTYDFSTLYTTLPHNLIKDKLIDLIERTFQREGSPYLACSDRNAFFTAEKPKKYHAWSCQNVCDALTFLLDNIFIRFGTKLYRQVVGIPMGTNCAPLVADLFLFVMKGTL